MSLALYRRKRNFAKTAEPPPDTGTGKKATAEKQFVIQKHAASRLHYDLRLELGGAFKSWAVPKGMPVTKGEKRLAMLVEDHPLAYGGFEGTIPKGEYGGGTVMLWDRGTWQPLSKTPAKDLKGGKLHFVLQGARLKGEWYLVRLRKENEWLVIKGGESMKPVPVRVDDSSVVSGKTMKQLAEGDSPVWTSASRKTSKLPSKPMATTKTSLEVEGRSVPVSNLSKVFYPDSGFTKGQVIDYYIRVAPVLMPHLLNRPVSLKRYPDGVEGIFFYEKQSPPNRPKWMKTARVPKEGGVIDYCLINNIPSLVWAANMANLELHTFLHRTPALQRPTFLAFDLDPGPPADIVNCFGVALVLKKVFEALGLQAFPKTSGSKGLQVYVPLNNPVNYDKTKEFARATAEALEERFPDLVVSKMAKNLRAGKVFVDWSQNDDKKTTVTVYSLRAKSEPTVSTPLLWKEVDAAFRRKKVLAFTSNEVLKRVAKSGDLFAPVLTLKQKLPPLASLAKEISEL